MFVLTNDSLYRELWGVYCEEFGELWPRYNGTVLYISKYVFYFMLVILLISVYSCDYFNCLVQDCSNSSALAMKLLQSCTMPSISSIFWPQQNTTNYEPCVLTECSAYVRGRVRYVWIVNIYNLCIRTLNVRSWFCLYAEKQGVLITG